MLNKDSGREIKWLPDKLLREFSPLHNFRHPDPFYQKQTDAEIKDIQSPFAIDMKDMQRVSRKNNSNEPYKDKNTPIGQHLYRSGTNEDLVSSLMKNSIPNSAFPASVLMNESNKSNEKQITSIVKAVKTLDDEGIEDYYAKKVS